ncbi:MAG: hypothetical protein ABL957_08685 [Parvularculaceae bacterium]
MRAILMVLAIAALVAGLWPQPFIWADWRTPFQEAVAQDDCVAAERILNLLALTGHDGASFEAAAQLGRLRKCRYADAANAKDTEGYAAQSDAYEMDLLTSIRRTSFLGTRIVEQIEGRPRSKDQAFREAERLWYSVWRECSDKYGEGYNGLANRRLLNYALSHDDLTTDDIYRISYEQLAFCAHAKIQIVKLMETSARSERDLDLTADALHSLWFDAQFAPDQSRAIAVLVAALEGRGKKVLALTEWGVPGGNNCSISYHALGSKDLWGSNLCAEKTLAAGQAPEAAYFARRARRLGARDIDAILRIAEQRLSAECASTVARLEAQEAADQDNPRDFKRVDQQWEGDACADE